MPKQKTAGKYKFLETFFLSISLPNSLKFLRKGNRKIKKKRKRKISSLKRNTRLAFTRKEYKITKKINVPNNICFNEKEKEKHISLRNKLHTLQILLHYLLRYANSIHFFLCRDLSLISLLLLTQILRHHF